MGNTQNGGFGNKNYRMQNDHKQMGQLQDYDSDGDEGEEDEESDDENMEVQDDDEEEESDHNF